MPTSLCMPGASVQVHTPQRAEIQVARWHRCCRLTLGSLCVPAGKVVGSSLLNSSSLALTGSLGIMRLCLGMSSL